MKNEADVMQIEMYSRAKPELRNQKRAEIETRIKECRAAGLETAACRLERELNCD